MRIMNLRSFRPFKILNKLGIYEIKTNNQIVKMYLHCNYMNTHNLHRLEIFRIYFLHSIQ